MKLQLILIFLIFINIINCGYVLIKDYNSDGKCEQVNSMTIQAEGVCIEEQVVKCNSEKNSIEWNIYSNCLDFENGTKPIGTKELKIDQQCNQANEIYQCLDEITESDLTPPENSDNDNNYVSIVFYNGNDCNNYSIENIQYFYSEITNQCDFDGYFGYNITCTPTQFTKLRYEDSETCSFSKPTNNITYSLPITTCSFENYHVKQFCNIK